MDLSEDEKTTDAAISATYHDIFNTMLLGMVESLEKRPRVVDVKIREISACPKGAVFEWQRKYDVKLPVDLQNFLAMSNGLEMAWSILLRDQVFEIGRLRIHGISNMRTIDGAAVQGETSQKSFTPHLDKEPQSVYGHDCDVVEIDRWGGTEHVALVYRDKLKPEVWFCDRSNTYHYIASSFTEYLKLMTAHLGISGWQYLFTPLGVGSTTRRWLCAFAPLRLEIARKKKEYNTQHHSGQADERPKKTQINLAQILQLVSEASATKTNPTQQRQHQHPQSQSQSQLQKSQSQTEQQQQSQQQPQSRSQSHQSL